MSDAMPDDEKPGWTRKPDGGWTRKVQARTLPDLVVEAEGYIAESLATCANSIRQRGAADGMTPEAIEDAIECALEQTCEELERFRREFPAWVNDCLAQKNS